MFTPRGPDAGTARGEPPVEQISIGKRIAFTTVLAGLVVLVAEASALVLAHRIATQDVVDFAPALLPARLHAPPRRQAAVALYEATYDPDLGWVNKRGYNFNGNPAQYTYDDQGARESTRPFANTRVSTYGDSFTHGDEVAPDQTWSQRLADQLHSNVLNFGVGGYGTDQAVLRVAKNCRAGRRTDVVVLGICSENVNRILGNLRAFYTNVVCLSCAANGPKPMFTKTAAGFELLRLEPQPLAALDAALDQARRHDFWYRGFSFPYVLSLLRWYSRDRDQVRQCGPLCEGRWDLPLARETMHFVLGQFLELSREYHFRPVVAFLPCWTDFVAVSAGKPPGYRRFLREAEQAQDLRGLTFVEVVGERFKPEYQRYLGSDGLHPGVEGHRLIADVLAPRVAPLLASEVRAANPSSSPASSSTGLGDAYGTSVAKRYKVVGQPTDLGGAGRFPALRESVVASHWTVRE